MQNCSIRVKMSSLEKYCLEAPSSSLCPIVLIVTQLLDIQQSDTFLYENFTAIKPLFFQISQNL